MVYGEDADFLKLIVEAVQLANDITRGLVLISVIRIVVSIALILFGIYLVVHIT